MEHLENYAFTQDRPKSEETESQPRTLLHLCTHESHCDGQPLSTLSLTPDTRDAYGRRASCHHTLLNPYT